MKNWTAFSPKSAKCSVAGDNLTEDQGYDNVLEIKLRVRRKVVVDEYVSVVEWNLRNEELPVAVPSLPPRLPHDVTWDWTRVCAVTSQHPPELLAQT
jgi:hypothetical protein